MKDFSGSDQETIFSTVVRHQGIVMVFALMKNDGTIYYRSLNPRPDVPNDDDNWSGLKKMEFPTLLRPVGMSLATRELTIAPKHELAPFRVLSDGRHVYIFRQSENKTLLVDRYVFDQSSLTLKQNYEARFQRSRKKDIPSGKKDSLGYEDMENKPFPEPTLEIDLTRKISYGNFAILLLPTDAPGQTRWVLLAGNDTEEQLDLFYVKRASDGLFDLEEMEEINLTLETQDGQNRLQIQDLDAITYAQQEQVKDENGRSRKIKRSMRMMLAARVQRGLKSIGSVPAVPIQFPMLVLDFAVTKNGKLTQVPDENTLRIPDVKLDSGQQALSTLLVDVQGTELKGGLLEPLHSKSAPFLMDGADGLVHLYYGHRANTPGSGAPIVASLGTGSGSTPTDDGQFMVAQFDATVARAKIEIPLLPEERSAQLVAIRPGTDLNDGQLAIAPGANLDHCSVTITSNNGDTVETWSDVPRRLDQFAAVLNGATTTDSQNSRLADGSVVLYDTAQKRSFTSQRPAYLVYDIPAGIGSVRLETVQPVVQDQSGIIIEIARGTRADFCKVTLQLNPDGSSTGSIPETWNDVPRDVDEFILVLSGMFSADPKDPRVMDGSKIL